MELQQQHHCLVLRIDPIQQQNNTERSAPSDMKQWCTSDRLQKDLITRCPFGSKAEQQRRVNWLLKYKLHKINSCLTRCGTHFNPYMNTRVTAAYTMSHVKKWPETLWQAQEMWIKIMRENFALLHYLIPSEMPLSKARVLSSFDIVVKSSALPVQSDILVWLFTKEGQK